MKKVILVQTGNGLTRKPYYGGDTSARGVHKARLFKTLKDAREYAKGVEGSKVVSMSFEAYVRQAFIDYVAFESGDRYGQVGCIDIYSVWGNVTDDVREWNKSAKMFVINCYGGRFGSYYGIQGLSGVNDAEVKEDCSEAFSNGERYKRAMTSW